MCSCREFLLGLSVVYFLKGTGCAVDYWSCFLYEGYRWSLIVYFAPYSWNQIFTMTFVRMAWIGYSKLHFTVLFMLLDFFSVSFGLIDMFLIYFLLIVRLEGYILDVISRSTIWISTINCSLKLSAAFVGRRYILVVAVLLWSMLHVAHSACCFCVLFRTALLGQELH